MTCAACATRIEKALNRLDGVDATVNLATEEAAVRYEDSSVEVEDLLAAVESVGYRAYAPGAERTEGAGSLLGLRLVVAAAAHRAGRADRHGSPLRLRRMGMGGPRAHDADLGLGGLAVPPGGDCERAPRGGLDGHAHLPRHDGRICLVGRRSARAGGRRGLLRGGERDHDAHPARPLARDPGPPPVGRRPAGAPRGRREGGARPAGRRGGRGADRGARRRRPVRRPARARRSRRTGSSSKAPRRSTSPC